MKALAGGDDECALVADGGDGDLRRTALDHLVRQLQCRGPGVVAAHQLLCLEMVEAHDVRLLGKGGGERGAGRVEHESGAAFAGRARQGGIDVLGYAGRQAAGRHHEAVAGGNPRRERHQQPVHFRLLMFRAGEDEAVVLPGHGLHDGEGEAGLAPRFPDIAVEAVAIEDGAILRPGRAGDHDERPARAAQLLDRARDVDAAAAGVVAGWPAPELTRRAQLLGRGGDVERRVERDGEDRLVGHASASGPFAEVDADDLVEHRKGLLPGALEAVAAHDRAIAAAGANGSYLIKQRFAIL